MNGASALPPVRTINSPSKSRMTTMGPSSHFLFSFKKEKYSVTIFIFDMPPLLDVCSFDKKYGYPEENKNFFPFVTNFHRCPRTGASSLIYSAVRESTFAVPFLGNPGLMFFY